MLQSNVYPGLRTPPGLGTRSGRPDPPGLRINLGGPVQVGPPSQIWFPWYFWNEFLYNSNKNSSTFLLLAFALAGGGH